MVSETNLAGTVVHEYFMASQLVIIIVKFLSVTQKPHWHKMDFLKGHRPGEQ